MRPRTLLVGALTLAVAMLVLAQPGWSQEPAPADSAAIAELSPPSPATLAPGTEVRISYRYDVGTRSRFRVIVRPMTGSEVSADYSAAGSPLHTPGRGSGSASFTLTQPGRVDRLRIVVAEEGSDRHLYRGYVDVDYRFAVQRSALQTEVLSDRARDVRVEAAQTRRIRGGPQLELTEKTLKQLGTYEPPIWRPLPENEVVELPSGNDGLPSCLQIGLHPERCAEVVGRRVTADGVIILDCADGSSWRTTSEGEVYTAPNGRSCRHLMMALRMGTALPPAEPPPDVGAAQWAEQLNAWLDQSVANNLLYRIQLLLGDQYFANYQQLESGATSNLYQRIDYRLAFLDKLGE